MLKTRKYLHGYAINHTACYAFAVGYSCILAAVTGIIRAACFIKLCVLQSKKKGLSLEEKRTRMMEIFFETVSFPTAELFKVGSISI